MGTNVVTPVVTRMVNTLLDNMFGIPKGPFHARPSSTNAVLLSPAQHPESGPKGSSALGLWYSPISVPLVPQLGYRAFPSWGTIFARGREDFNLRRVERTSR